MTFKDVIIKNFKGNFNRYLVYFLGNIFIISNIFILSNFLLSKELEDSGTLEKGVVDTLQLPIIALVLFTLMFTSLCYSNFIKSRTREFGLFMNLGMSLKDIRILIILENLLISFISIIVSMIIGVIFSRMFFIAILYFIDVKDFVYKLNYSSFLYSIGGFMLINIMNIIVTLFKTRRFTVINLIKDEKEVIYEKRYAIQLFILGIVMMIASIILTPKWMAREPQDAGGILSCGVLTIFTGAFLIISNVIDLFIKIAKRNKKFYYKNMLWIKGLQSKIKASKYFIFIMTIFLSLSVFYLGSVLKFKGGLEYDTVKNNNWDITIFQGGEFNNIAIDDIENILEDNGSKVLESEEIDFIYYCGVEDYPGAEVIISTNELQRLGVNIDVKPGEYKLLKQYNELSKEEIKEEFPLKLVVNNNIRDFNYSGVEYSEIFRSENYNLNTMTVLNAENYGEILKNKETYDIGKVKVIKVKDWKDSSNGVKALETHLKKINQGKSIKGIYIETDKEFEVKSKITTYTTNKQALGILIFTCSYLGIFFLVAVSAMLLLKLIGDLDKDRERFKSINKIGLKKKEGKKIITRELLPLFFIGIFLGGVIGIAITIFLVKSDGSTPIKEFIKGNISVIGFYFIFQCCYLIYAKNKYYNMLN